MTIANPGVDTNATLPTSNLAACAILLDIDGTIVDFAPTPQQVSVSPELRRTLSRLQQVTHGALALVSGRKLSEIDLLFAPLSLAAIGGHGAEIRPVPGAAAQARASALSKELKQQLVALAGLGTGILVEDKGYSLALHYRLAPKLGPALHAGVTKICALAPPGTVEVLPGKAVVEVKPAQVSKALAVRELMTLAPFARRLPVFVGDDVTDEPVFGVISDFGGVGFSVGRIIPGANGHFEKPENVRAWLARIAADRGSAAE
jgi:trehalose 6-phosphate phosphatase